MDKPDHRITKLRAALARGETHDLEDVVEALRAGTMQAFWNDDAVIVTEIATTPRAKVLFIFLAAGTLQGVLALRPQLEAFMDAHGIERARSQVRPGFARILQKHGFRPRTVGVEYLRGA